MSLLVDQIDAFDDLGVTVHLPSLPQILEVIDAWIADRRNNNYIVATGMHGIMESNRSTLFKSVLDAADLFIPDGFSLVVAARFWGHKGVQRVSGPDLMQEACQHADKMGYSMFFLGDTDDTLAVLSEKLLNDFPSLRITGMYSPPFRDLTYDEDQSVITMINNSGADILWVGLGLPKQEQWMYDHKEFITVPVSVGVGAAFRFISGKTKRAPRWIGQNGFEWLWRLIFEPRRVWRRVLLDGPHFIGFVARKRLDSISFFNSK